MIKRKVKRNEINGAKIDFFKDMGYNIRSQKDVKNFLKYNNMKCEQEENQNIIYFKLVDINNNVVMYSRPLLKYIRDDENEIAFMVKNPEGSSLKTICLTESALPIHNYNKIRNGLYTKKEIEEQKNFKKDLFK